MPEKGVVALFRREVDWMKLKRQLSSKVDLASPGASYGKFVTHPQCCARPTGRRQTFTPHISGPSDPLFTQLPIAAGHSSSGYYCNSCHSASDEDEEDPEPLVDDDENSTSEDSALAIGSCKFTAESVNTLDISGQIYAKDRGKELAIVICNPITHQNFVMRINFGTEAHVFWMPTEWYQEIVSKPPVHRGKKSFAYIMPDEYVDGPAHGCLISLQAAFVCPEWTLVFVDHQVFIQFHLMQLSDSFLPSDLQPGSKFWPSLWSRTHGPVYHQEPEATLECLQRWRSKTIDTSNRMAIFEAVKKTQTVFNGCGAQETTDLLLLAFIHPQMPALYVCANSHIWSRLVAALIWYDKDRATLGRPDQPMPYISGPRPIRFNPDGHTKYLSTILAYRRSHVTLSGKDLQTVHDLGLFLSDAVIEEDGRARAANSSSPSIPTQLRNGRKSIRVPNFAITWHSGKTKHVTYTPFTAKPASDWQKVTRETVGSDVRDEVNKTTLGLYSFRLLVDCVWSAKTVSKAGIPLGRRPLLTVGNSNRKRPRAAMAWSTRVLGGGGSFQRTKN
ncbi:hypothetical protein B0H16DRAFT_1902854 [Mycena metata]|uniref:Uncharacterized protein n=1 Tax=Mycena metata TaxID=1033252 RepID=A0AAD7DVW3_9AGAR|nr:hypothetical protein B0H16DRAFT_1902854 [Mycena metata]